MNNKNVCEQELPSIKKKDKLNKPDFLHPFEMKTAMQILRLDHRNWYLFTDI